LGALELAEDLGIGLARNVGEHVEPATVRHTDADLVQVLGGSAAQDPVQQRDHRLATLEAESLLPHVLGLQERLERLGRVEPPQDSQLFLG